LLSKLKAFYGSFESAWTASNYDDFLNANPHFALETIENLTSKKGQ